MSTQSVIDLLGDELGGTPPRLEREVAYIPMMQLGDGLAGPENDQPLEIFRDTRVLAVDELGMGHLGKLARHRAGRAFPLNEEWGAWFDPDMPGRPPTQDTLRPSPLYPGQSPSWHDGVAAPEVIRGPGTVFFTATPQVGWEGY